LESILLCQPGDIFAGFSVGTILMAMIFMGGHISGLNIQYKL
jgi:hypothetical protein